jgi:hypothetical protein
MQEAKNSSSAKAPGGRNREGTHLAITGKKVVNEAPITPKTSAAVRKKRRRETLLCGMI